MVPSAGYTHQFSQAPEEVGERCGVVKQDYLSRSQPVGWPLRRSYRPNPPTSAVSAVSAVSFFFGRLRRPTPPPPPLRPPPAAGWTPTPLPKLRVCHPTLHAKTSKSWLGACLPAVNGFARRVGRAGAPDFARAGAVGIKSVCVYGGAPKGPDRSDEQRLPAAAGHHYFLLRGCPRDRYARRAARMQHACSAARGACDIP